MASECSDILHVTNGNAKFANQFYSSICKDKENVIFSPLSAYTVLAMVYQEAAGDTEQKFASTLNVPNQKVAANGCNSVMKALNSVENVTLHIANKILELKDFPLKAAFQKTATELFLAEIESINSAASEDAANNINQWVENKTKSSIKDLISTHVFNAAFRSVFANAVYYKSNWTHQFNKIYKANIDAICCEMMNISARLNYREDGVLHAKIVELPLNNENVSMVVILPDASDGIGDLESKLMNVDLTTLTQNLQFEQVEVTLPKFKIESTMDLKSTLEKMGLGIIFESQDFDISKLSQRVYVNVNHEGVEVAGATASKWISLSSSGEEEGEFSLTVPTIYDMHVKSNISNRFAHTTITSKVKNMTNKPHEVTFSVVLPETAFISGFVMEIDGKSYTAYVKEKEEAKKTYDQAVATGLGAGHVAVSARDSNRFTVSVNVEPKIEAVFNLTYEQLLKRQDGHYEQVINLHPGQPVKKLTVEVAITESRKIIELKAPPLRSGKEIGNEKSDLDPKAELEFFGDTAAIVRFTPNLERQKQLAQLLGSDEKNGLAGQFVVQYDVERDPKGGEVLVQDGYFVHFFAPSELAPLSKHAIFVLDTSGSMRNKKIEQLKQAMYKILEQLKINDELSLVEFNNNVKVWDLNNSDSSVWYPTRNYHYGYTSGEEEISFENVTFPNAYPANGDGILKAQRTVSQLIATGGTDIHTALRVGLHLVEKARGRNTDAINRQPVIVFLTDGDPTVRLTSTEEILKRISEFNSGSRKAPIFALSFGADAIKSFLQRLAYRNYGFSKHIYEAADASLQLQDFYKQISSPLLTDVTFKYQPSVTSLTTTEFPIHFGGSELIVCGWCGADVTPPVVDGWSANGRISFQPTVERSISNIERMWAYLTVRQLLEQIEAADKDKEVFKKKALDLALKYSFVTPLSSLVVVKPDVTTAVDTEEAAAGGHKSKKNSGQRFGSSPDLERRKKYVRASRGSSTFESYEGSLQSGAPQSSNLFGSPSSTGQQQSQIRFGGPAGPSLYGSQQQSQFSFGGSTGALQSAAPPSSNLFGSPSSMNQQQSQFGFGSSTGPSSNLFWSSSSTSQQQSQFGFGGPTGHLQSATDQSFPFGIPNSLNQQLSFGGSTGVSGGTPFVTPQKIQFNANRPFIVLLQVKHQDSTNILFYGKYTK